MIRLENQLYTPELRVIDQRNDELVKGLAFGLCISGVIWIALISVVIWALS